jgi:hypothetical protein
MKNSVVWLWGGIVLLWTAVFAQGTQPVLRVLSTLPTGSLTTAVVLHDFNQDRKLDLAVATIILLDEQTNRKRLYVTIQLGSGTGSFDPPQRIEFNSVDPDAEVQVPQGKVLTAGDVNNDGQVDLVLAYPAGDTFWVFLGDGTGNLRPLANRDLPRNVGAVSSIVLADFNGDRKLDIAVVTLRGRVTIFLNNGTEQIDRWPTREQAIGGSLRSLASGDFNGDGKIDLAVAAIGRVTVLLNDGMAEFAVAQHMRVGLYEADSPVWIEAADVNSDGSVDLITANPDSDHIFVLVGDGQGNFKDPQAFPAQGLDPRAIAIADFNDDGKRDLVTANSASDDVSLLLNDGSGAFTTVNKTPVGSLPVALASGDLDGDNDPDLVVANQGDGSVSVLINERR